MELFSGTWWTALLTIILIDLVLAGDNAIVIALAARNLPKNLQKKAIIWGTVGAIIVRSIMTIGVVYLLTIPGLRLIGGLGLLWIAYNLIAESDDNKHGDLAITSFWAAMKTIIIADALMGIDNVLGVAGAAHGDFILVVAGLIISVPIVVFGSTLVLTLVERFPIIIQFGAAVLAYTAAKMIIDEPLLLKTELFKLKEIISPAIAATETTKAIPEITKTTFLGWSLTVACILGILGLGYLVNNRKQPKGENENKN